MSTKHLPNPAHQSPHSANTCIPERRFLMADVHLLEKLNMGEVGVEEIKGALHENLHWKCHWFAWYGRTVDTSATSPDDCSIRNPWQTGKWCPALFKKLWGWNYLCSIKRYHQSVMCNQVLDTNELIQKKMGADFILLAHGIHDYRVSVTNCS